MSGYVVVIEGDDTEGYGAYSPDLPGVVAAGMTKDEVTRLIREAMTDHVALLRELGEPVPPPTTASGVVLVDPTAA